MKKLLFTILASVLLLSACGKMKTTDDLIKKHEKKYLSPMPKTPI